MRKKRTGFIQSLENAISCHVVLSFPEPSGVYLRIYTSLMNYNNSRIACLCLRFTLIVEQTRS